MSKQHCGDEVQPRTLYVGNLDCAVSETLIHALFGKIGHVKSCKIIQEANNDPYCFVEFAEHSSAAAALSAMNKRVCLGKPFALAPTSPQPQGLYVMTNPYTYPYTTSPYYGVQFAVIPSGLDSILPSQEMKVNWATSPSNCPKQDTSKHYHIFVGDLCHDVQTFNLEAAFKPFGEISDCKIIRDPQTLKSKGYGFVSFVHKCDADKAIKGMNGQWLGSRAIRTNWATRKPPAPNAKEGRIPHNMQSGGSSFPATTKPQTFEEVYSQSSPTNCTVYCGGITTGLTQELIQSSFGSFGNIEEIRIFKDKGYAFIRYNNKDSATQAIVQMNGSEVGGYTVKCSWGKESNDTPQQPAQTQQFPGAAPAAVAGMAQGYSNCYGHQMAATGYYYPYNQMQGSAYMQNATAGQYYGGYQPYGMQPQIQGYGISTNVTPTQAQAAGQPQFNGQQGVMGYPMQQGYQQVGYQQQAQ